MPSKIKTHKADIGFRLQSCMALPAFFILAYLAPHSTGELTVYVSTQAATLSLTSTVRSPTKFSACPNSLPLSPFPVQTTAIHPFILAHAAIACARRLAPTTHTVKLIHIAQNQDVSCMTGAFMCHGWLSRPFCDRGQQDRTSARGLQPEEASSLLAGAGAPSPGSREVLSSSCPASPCEYTSSVTHTRTCIATSIGDVPLLELGLA